jgi:DNA polymerase IV
MDAFYASVEQRDFPELRGKPLVVGGLPEGRGGVVATASYEARKFGVRSAMPSKQAQRLCPEAVFVRPRFEVYKQVSAQIREIFFRFTDLVEPLSLDEAYLDVTEDKQGIGSALEVARRIKTEINDKLRLTASAGVSINKFLAKIASDIQKPDGLTFIGPSSAETFMEKLPVGKFFGVGQVTARRMNGLGIFTGADLKKLSESELVRHFGKQGRFLFEVVRGRDDREVRPDRERKSVGAEDTFAHDLADRDEMLRELSRLCGLVSTRLNKQELSGRTVTLKVKFADFRQITRSTSLREPVAEAGALYGVISDIFAKADLEGNRVRLLGVSVSNFKSTPGAEEWTLFPDG